MNKIKLIKNLAILFREAIEGMDITQFPESSYFKDFPCGCCGDASDLLSKFLAEHNIQAEYVWGMYKGQSHGWLEYKGYIIDVTADQFPEINKKVIVTTDKTWHNRFKNQQRSFHDFEEFGDPNQKRLSDIYKNFKRFVESDTGSPEL